MQIKLQSDNYHVLLNTLGAELNSYSNPSGNEYVWNSDPTYWLRSSPLLFPTVGNVRNGETVIKDHIYQMPKHGFCKESEFEVTEQTEDSVTFLLKANEETLKHYPYDFKLYLSYHLNGSTLSMDYRVINKDSDLMYYHIGAHPGFMCPVNNGENIENCILRFEKEENFISYEYDIKNLEFNFDHKVSQKAEGNTLPLTISMFDQDAVFFEHTNSHQLQEKVFTYIIMILNPLQSGHRPEERLRFSVWSHGTVPAFFIRMMIFLRISMGSSHWNPEKKKHIILRFL